VCATASSRHGDNYEKRAAVEAALSHLTEAQANLRRAAEAEGKELLGQPAGGRKPRGVAGCYALVRQIAQSLHAAEAKTLDHGARTALESALGKVYAAEDELTKADA
jgi:hypothetical protein